MPGTAADINEQSDAGRVKKVGEFRLFLDRRLLTRGGAPVVLGGRALDILLYLASREGEIVGKHALMEAVWPGRAMAENNLTVHIAALRRVLGQTEDAQSAIRTVPGRGYMFIADTLPSPEALDRPVPLHARPALAPASGFVGRVTELADIADQLSRHRLVTITAAGGVGKTRLAREVARALAPDFPNGVHVAELGNVDAPDLVIEQVAKLFPQGSAGGFALERLTNTLRNSCLLLVLDNCEHLVGPVSTLIAAILECCPGVSILATSREALGVGGERVVRLQPLSVPDQAGPDEPAMDAGSALRYDAVRLFVERATASVPGFVFDDKAAPAVVDICRRVDGIALAIEMAVPRLRVLSLADLAERLKTSLDLLTTADRTAVPRHRTLRAMIDWSYALLSTAQQRMLQRLVVFAGAIEMEAVQAVAGETGKTELDTLEDLTALVEKSLVVADISDGRARYRLLAAVREYARDRLAEQAGPHEGPMLRHRHAAYYAATFEAAAAAWPCARTADWLPRAAADADELRAALAWCFGPEGDRDLGLRLAGASTPLWWELPTLPLREARSWFDRAVAHLGPETPPLVAARVWFGHAWPEMRQADTENLPAAEQAVALFRQTPDRLGLGGALWRAGSAALRPETTAQAAQVLDEAERVLREQPPSKWLALCLIRQGDVHMRAGDNASALAAYEEGMALSRSTGNWYGLTNGGSNLADLLFQLGRRDEALTLLRELRNALPPGPRTPLTCTLAAHLAAADLIGEASEALAEVVDRAPGIGYASALARAMEILAMLRAERGDPATAARLAGYARKVMPPATRWGAPRAVFDRLETALAQGLDETRMAQLLQQGAEWGEPAVAAIARQASEEQLRTSRSD
jgi:predicted ATPase/DNA-binding winged helix-turn-helix (wHTH) protein